MMKTSQAGINLIKKFERLRTTAYKCPAGVWTIGYGHTEDVKKGDTISPEEAEEIFKEDLRIYEAIVIQLNINLESRGMFDALVSLAYNIGGPALRNSTLVRKLRTGDILGAADEFLRWNRAGKKVLPGLTTRRKAERELFLGD